MLYLVYVTIKFDFDKQVALSEGVLSITNLIENLNKPIDEEYETIPFETHKN